MQPANRVESPGHGQPNACPRPECQQWKTTAREFGAKIVELQHSCGWLQSEKLRVEEENRNLLFAKDALKALLQEAATKLKTLESHAQVLEDERARLDTASSDNDQMIHMLEMELRQAREQLGDKQRELNEKLGDKQREMDRISALLQNTQRELDDKGRQLASKQRELDVSDRSLGDKDAELRTAKERSKKLENERGRWESRVAEVETLAASRQRDADRMARENEGLRKEIERQRAELHRLQLAGQAEAALEQANRVVHELRALHSRMAAQGDALAEDELERLQEDFRGRSGVAQGHLTEAEALARAAPFPPANFRERHKALENILQQMASLALQELEPCVVCLSRHRICDMNHIGECGHYACSDCLLQHIRSRYKDAAAYPMKCPGRHPNRPDAQCETVITEGIAVVVGLGRTDPQDVDVFARYTNLATFIPDPRHRCRCPHKDCLDVVEWDPEGPVRQVTCNGCKKKYCARCRIPWHTDLTCQQYQALPEDERSEEDRAAIALAKQLGWPKCPGPGCGMYVERSIGCNHMRCLCTQEFCYIASCRAMFTKDHTAACRGGQGDAQCKHWSHHYSTNHPLFSENDILQH